MVENQEVSVDAIVVEEISPAVSVKMYILYIFIQYYSIAFGGVFSHYKGDSNTTELTTKRQFLAQNDQFNDNVKDPRGGAP